MNRLALATLTVAATALLGGSALAQSGGGYDLHWNDTGAGGAVMAGGAYTLTGTVGQHAASVACANGYTVRSGLLSGVSGGDVIFRNGFEAGC